MAKGWIKIKTVNDSTYDKSDSTRKKKDNDFNMLIKNTKILPAKELKKQSEILFAKQQIENEKLLDAFENKKVKSKTAIKRALQLKKERAKLEKIKPTEQVEQSDSTATEVMAEESKESDV